MRFSPRYKPKGVYSSLTLRTDGIASRTGIPKRPRYAELRNGQTPAEMEQVDNYADVLLLYIGCVV